MHKFDNLLEGLTELNGSYYSYGYGLLQQKYSDKNPSWAET